MILHPNHYLTSPRLPRHHKGGASRARHGWRSCHRASSWYDWCLNTSKSGSPTFVSYPHFRPLSSSVRSRLNQIRLSHRRSLRHIKRISSPHYPTRLTKNEAVQHQHQEHSDQEHPVEYSAHQQSHSRCTNITQLPPEILARIFHYVYISPVVIFPFQAKTAQTAATTTAAAEEHPSHGQCSVERQESMTTANAHVGRAEVFCTIEEEHTVIEDEYDIPSGGNASSAYPPFLPQAEGTARGEGEIEGANWIEHGCMSRIVSEGSSSSSINSRNNSMSRGDITDSVDVDMGEACLTTGGTARVIEGTTNRRSTALISTPAVGQQHVSHVQPNNTNTSSSNSSNGSNNNNTIDNNSSDIHLTHFEEGYIINTTDNDNINNNSNNSNSHTNHSVHHTDVASDRHPSHLQQQQHHEIYIENDLFTLFNLCLTCRTFYAQAIRLLWRQRTLSTAHELKGFYDTLTRSLALSSRPKDALNQQQPKVVEAALRIKSLTLLDMCLSDVSDSFSPANWATTPSFVRQSFTDHYDSNHGRTNGSGGAGSGTGATHMHFRHRSNSGHYPQQFDPYYLPSDQDNYINNNGSSSSNSLIKWEHDTAAATSTSKNGSSSSPTPSALSSPARERASWAPGYSSTYGYDNTFWPSFSSSSSASTSQWAAAAAVAANSSSSRSHMRQKTTSIYSDIISPRLLHMVAQYCHALTDLTICIQSSELSTVTAPTDPSTTTSTAPSVRRQPTITFSFLAGALPSLRRLTLAGVVCDPDQNKTGSELLAFARTIQPLETLNIRSCQGISDETLIILAERSGPALERLDFQGMDFKDSEQLAMVVKSFVRHCPNLTSLTLSCMASLDLDESLQAFVDCEQRGASRLKELQILGHDHVVAQQQQQQQQQGMNNNEGGADGQQQPQEELQSVTTMCRLSDHVLLGLGRMPRLARLTLYCTGLTDLALIRFMSCAPCLEDLVLHEPTPVLHLPQLHSLTHYLFTHALSTTASTSTTTATNNLTTGESAEATTLTSAAGSAETSAPSPSVSPEQLTTTSPPFEYTSASFLHLVLNRRFRRRLSSLFIKISIETAQDWISQPVFQASGLASCLYQYQNAHSGEPAVVLIWRP